MAWLASERTADPLARQHERKTLAQWFHELARKPGEPRGHCAYCEGSLEETSPATVDHSYPRREFDCLALTWTNLFPCCAYCNSTYKRTQWSCRLVRPDVDPVDDLFDFDEQTGQLLPNAGASHRDQARVRLTIRVFGLNTAERCRARLTIWRSLRAARKHPPDSEDIERYAKEGPYRLVGWRFLKSLEARPILVP
jgi:uncharacterized protein (TIGR02646 family)